MILVLPLPETLPQAKALQAKYEKYGYTVEFIIQYKSNSKIMNKVLETDTMVIHDDREALTMEQAIDALWNGKIIRICDPPDFSAENECDVYAPEFMIDLNDIDSPGTWEKMSKEACYKKIENYLTGYELYK
jgi:ABC-type proline/glycine betaine transport system ATPase subunit